VEKNPVRMKIKSGGAISGILILSLTAFAIPAAALNVCADPNYLPYSNRAGEGFENKIADAVAKALGETVSYTWASYRGHGGFPQFLSSTLDAKKCDVVMNIPYGSREELTTRPYYTSAYVFVFEKSKNYGIATLNAPALKKLKVGFERDTPAEGALKIRGMIPGAVAFEVGEENDQSPAGMLTALKDGAIDVLITWQPAISSFLGQHPQLDVVQVPNERTLGAPEQFAFPMAMAVRFGDEALKRRLDDVIATHQAELTSILTESRVMVFASTPGTR
jgi:mxaJ protein